MRETQQTAGGVGYLEEQETEEDRRQFTAADPRIMAVKKISVRLSRPWDKRRSLLPDFVLN
jgi:hypothetical protein